MKLPIDKNVYDALLEQMDILDISCATIRQSGAIAKALEAQSQICVDKSAAHYVFR